MHQKQYKTLYSGNMVSRGAVNYVGSHCTLCGYITGDHRKKPYRNIGLEGPNSDLENPVTVNYLKSVFFIDFRER